MMVKSLGKGIGHVSVARLASALCTATTGTRIRDKLHETVKRSKVVVFMKGDPEQPRCGFSNAVVQVLRMHGVNYEAHDVLQDEAVRNGIKEYSNWPTIPQVYIDGVFVGGCDIIMDMHRTGQLIENLKKAGIRSALLDATQNDQSK